MLEIFRAPAVDGERRRFAFWRIPGRQLGPAAVPREDQASFTFLEIAAVAYLLLPSALLLFEFSRGDRDLLVPLALFAVAIHVFRRGVSRPRWNSSVLPFALLAIGVVMLSGIGLGLAENSDWIKHYAILNELVHKPWPPVVEWNGQPYELRYTLGWYVFPALAIKLLGLWATQGVILAWSALGVFLSLSLAFPTMGKQSAAYATALLFLGFSGADIVGQWYTGNPPRVLMHVEWWAAFGQYSSNITSIFWTPQHAISAWIGAFLFWRHPERSLGVGLPLGVAILLWSPFSAVGLFPVVVLSVLKVGVRPVLTVVNVVAGCLLLYLAFVFLSRGAAGIPVSVWTGDPSIKLLALFHVLEIGAIAAATVFASRGSAKMVVPLAGALALLLFVRGGAFNDLMMRGSVPALAVIFALASEAMTKEGWRRTPLIVCFVAGLATPLGEIMRGVTVSDDPGITNSGMGEVLQGSEYLAPQYLVPLNR